MKTKLALSFAAILSLFLAFCFVYASDWGRSHRSKRIRVMRDSTDLAGVPGGTVRRSVGYDPYFCRVNDFRLPPFILPAHQRGGR